jgi:hypothetical protein
MTPESVDMTTLIYAFAAARQRATSASLASGRSITILQRSR